MATSYGGAGLNLATYGSTSVSNLAQRLSPRTDPPGNLNLAQLFLVWALSSLVLAYLFADHIWDISHSTDPWYSNAVVFILMLGPGIPLGIIPAYLLAGIDRFAHPIARPRWFRRTQYLQGCYYCHRDDVAFDADIYASPGNFVDYVFSQRNDT